MSTNYSSDQETIDYSTSQQLNTFVENDFSVHLRKPKYFVPDVISDHQAQIDNENNFTNLESCLGSIHDDSEGSRSSSPVILNNQLLKPIYCSYNQTQNHLERDEDHVSNESTLSYSLLDQYHLKSSDELLDLIKKDPYKFIFKSIPQQTNSYMQCRFVRDKSGLFQTFHLEVELENHQQPICLLTAEKDVKMLGPSPYLISIHPNLTTEHYSIELICNNATGTSYTLSLLNQDQQQTLAIILYESNFLGLHGPRKMKVLLPKSNNQIESFPEENEINEYSSKQYNDSFIGLRNKTPIWNDETHSYVLQFIGKNRITIPSIKNFQMILDNKEHAEQLIMQFGQMTENIFSCDFQYPLSFIQAFGVALTAFETRLFRE